MTAPTFKIALATEPGTTTQYGAPDFVYALQVMNGTHSTDRLQAGNIEHLTQPLSYDVVIFISGSNVYAVKSSDGTVMAVGANSTAEVPNVFQAAFNYYAQVAPRPIVIVVRPGIYEFNGGTSAKILPNTTLIGYGATVKELVHDSSMIRGDSNGGALTAQRINVNIIGLTFDFNYLGQELNFPGNTTVGSPTNILIKDCKFIHIKDAQTDAGLTKSQISGTPTSAQITQMRSDSARAMLIGGASSDINFRSNNISYINNYCDAEIPGNNTGGEYAVFQMQATDGGRIIGNTICNAPAIKETAFYVYGYNRNVIISNNICYGNFPAVSDLKLQQLEDSAVTGNVFTNFISASNLKNVSVSNNNLYRFRLSVYDKSSVDADTNVVILRTTNNLLVCGNSLDTTSTSHLGTVNADTIDLEYSDFGDGTNPMRNVAVVGNQAKSFRRFIHLLKAQDNQPTPNQNIVVSGNHCIEREANDTNFAPITIVGNTNTTTPVPSQGWRNLFFSGNYVGPLFSTGAQGPYRDVAITSTGMENVVFRDNWFNGTGIDVVDSYPSAAQNYGGTTTTRYSNSGVSSITGTNASVTVTHGVEYTPAATDIYITPTTIWGASTKFWVDNITATTFRINRDSTASATFSFAWQVSRRL